MLQGSRQDRVGDLIRSELGQLVARQLKDPGIGFLTFTYVRVTRDLQLARIYYLSLANPKGMQEAARALIRATPFLRRQLSKRLKLKRVPHLEFIYDDSVKRQDRVINILNELKPQNIADDANAGTDDQNQY